MLKETWEELKALAILVGATLYVFGPCGSFWLLVFLMYLISRDFLGVKKAEAP